MTEAQDMQTLDLTPSPRILEVIAETDLQIHQCLAELIDNCFDDLQKAHDADPDHEGRVDISLPTSRSAGKKSEIVVADTGRGMSREQMESALRAGSTTNSQFGTLGLFGMGFNVATARLGVVTEVRSGRRGDQTWNVATIDLSQMRRNDSYQVPFRQEEKAAGEHGTIITVSSLRDDTVAKLQRPNEVSKVRNQLGNLYTYMIRDPQRSSYSGSDVVGGLGLSMYVNGNAVKATLPCVWDPSRSVPYRGQTVHAVQRIDFPLATAHACMDCGYWSTLSTDACPECGSEDVQPRERRIWGWLGVQRYLHSSDFGISLIRQGRVINHRDKTLFDWVDDDGSIITEYPIELRDGRLVGEIHLDHAPVNFRKTDFDRSAHAWGTMVRLVRGEAPLKPNKAKELGYAENDSPLGRLFSAYRRNNPGLRYLIPGDGRSALHELSREWAKLFQNGDPEYATDAAWYDAAKRHDDTVLGRTDTISDTDSGTDEWLAKEGLGHLTGESPMGVPIENGGAFARPVEPEPSTPPLPETKDQRFARYRENSRPLSSIEGRAVLGSKTTNLRCYLTDGVDLAEDNNGGHFAIRMVGGEVEMFIASSHPLVTDYGWDPADVALVCSAPVLKEVLRYPGTIDQFALDVLARRGDRRLDYNTVRARAESLIDLVRERLTPIVKVNPVAYWEVLRPSSKREAEKEAHKSSQGLDWVAMTESGDFANYLTTAGIKDVLAAHPAELLDGGVFHATYATWQEDSNRVDQVDRLSVLLGDLNRMLAVSKGTNPRELARFVLSAELLSTEVVDE